MPFTLPLRSRLAELPPGPSRDVERGAFRLQVAAREVRYGDHVDRALGAGTFQGERTMTLARRLGVLQKIDGVAAGADVTFIPDAAT